MKGETKEVHSNKKYHREKIILKLGCSCLNVGKLQGICRPAVINNCMLFAELESHII